MCDSESAAISLEAVLPTRCREADPCPGEVSIAELRPGQGGRVVRLDPTEPARMAKLLALGILPGARVLLRRRFPCFLVQVGNSQFALDTAVARSVRVRPT